MIQNEFDLVSVIKQLRYLRLQRLLAIDGLASRPQIAGFELPRDIEEMKERMKNTKEGALEMQALGVGDNLIIVDDQKDATEADKEQTKIINIM